MRLKTLRHDAKIAGKRILLRLDLNIPIDISGRSVKVVDDSRIIEAVPAIVRLHRAGARTIIISHLGEPGGNVIAKLKLHPVAMALRRHLPPSVTLIEHSSWDWNRVHKAAATLKPGEVLMLENLRFCKGEEANDKKFAQALAALADIYINEAFSVSHRAHASLEAIARYLPSFAGWHLVDEVAALSRVRDNPHQPLVMLLGGAKVHAKTELMISLAKKCAVILVGGLIANTIWKIKKISIGRSGVDSRPPVKQLLKLLKQRRRDRRHGHHSLVILPIDVVVARTRKDRPRLVNFSRGDKVASHEIIYDIGPATVGLFSEFLRTARTIIWNGPLGVIEDKRYAFGSLAMARLIAARSDARAFSVVGGGESRQALDAARVADEIDFCSTGGGAMLAFLAGEPMPGLDALKRWH